MQWHGWGDLQNSAADLSTLPESYELFTFCGNTTYVLTLGFRSIAVFIFVRCCSTIHITFGTPIQKQGFRVVGVCSFNLLPVDAELLKSCADNLCKLFALPLKLWHGRSVPLPPQQVACSFSCVLRCTPDPSSAHDFKRRCLFSSSAEESFSLIIKKYFRAI